jgi:4-hydroxy-tetrahydrodipicolinate synthase
LLNAADRQRILDTYRQAAITPVASPEEEFVVGKTAYARGLRASDLSTKPLYV